MARHEHRGTNGRFAPLPPDGDSSAYEHVVSPSADPQLEHDRVPGYPEFYDNYPTREFTHPDGSYSPLRGRRQVVIDAQTGQQLDAHITDVRAVDARSNFGVGKHVVGVVDDGLGGEFGDATYPHYDGPDTVRGYRRTPGSVHRLPAMGQSDRDAEWRG